MNILPHLPGLVLAVPAAVSLQIPVHPGSFALQCLWLAIILVSAKIGGEIALRLNQPPVLGELIVGIVLGSLTHLGYVGLDPIKADPLIDVLSRIGVLVLLFEVGLESTVGQMLKVGISALVVAGLGVLAPFALGWGVAAWLLPNRGPYVHAFLGATLTATSIGITARVLKDLGKSQSKEARLILGAAVVDDVLGLVILAMVTGLISSANSGVAVSAWSLTIPFAKAAGFLFTALLLGVLYSQRVFSLASRLRTKGVLLALGLSFCFFLSWIAYAVGLAPIVGAFAAGLILEKAHYTSFVGRGERALEELIHPISLFLAPIFFVLMGMQTDLSSFFRPGILVLALAITAAAIIGKQACSLGVIGPGVDRLSVGIGMIPRGEVGLIFANIGMALTVAGGPVVDDAEFSAIVVMVLLTTMLTPPALKWSLNRRRSPRDLS